MCCCKFFGAVVKVINKVKKIQNTIGWNEFAKSGKAASVIITNYELNRPAIMMYSAGTTGVSKGIQLTNDNINATITEGRYIDFEWKHQDRYKAVVPIWFPQESVLSF